MEFNFLNEMMLFLRVRHRCGVIAALKFLGLLCWLLAVFEKKGDSAEL
jgi:hypothetical protein